MAKSSEVYHIGYISSSLKDLNDCPKQGYEGAPAARLHIDPAYHDALLGIRPGSRIVVLTWFDKADRSVLQVHPRGNPKNSMRGVFMTRSPVRPNPMGLHEVRVKEIEEPGVLLVEPLEALDNTPIVDIKMWIPSRLSDKSL